MEVAVIVLNAASIVLAITAILISRRTTRTLHEVERELDKWR